MKQKKVLIFFTSILVSILSIFITGIDLPESFGKTQFIIGYDKDAARDSVVTSTQIQAGMLPSQQGNHLHVLFSPDDNIRQALINLIKYEQESIRMAAFILTDPLVTRALLDAHKRGIVVEIVADQSSLKGSSAKVVLLHDNGIPVHIYVGVAAVGMMSNIMHNKFIIFGKNRFNSALVWTGSFNFTLSAQENNQENVVILSDAYIVDKYQHRFDLLKKRCVACDKVNVGYRDKVPLRTTHKRAKNSLHKKDTSFHVRTIA